MSMPITLFSRGTIVALSPLLLALRCEGLYDETRRIESARLYGNIDELAYYYVDVLVGTPEQRVSLIVDTGSNVAAFACSGCRHCGHHLDPAFDFRRSSTAQWSDCDGRKCLSQCKAGYCYYSQSYTEGSSVSGYYFEDAVRLGDDFQHNPPTRTRLGCHSSETKLFFTQKANGILGIGPRGATILREFFADKNHVGASVFAVCLSEQGGRLMLGGNNDSSHKGPMTHVPLRTSDGYYNVKASTMRVNGIDLNVPLGESMLDTGTTYTYMSSKAYRALRRAIETYCAAHNGCGAEHFGTCWKLADGDPYQPGGGISLFPSVEVLFESVVVPWHAVGYLFRKTSTTLWCYSFQDDGPRAYTTLGASFMLHREVVFDLDAMRVGLAEASCPEFQIRPHKAPPPPLSFFTLWPPSRVLPAVWAILFVLSLVLVLASVLGIRSCLRRSGASRAEDDVAKAALGSDADIPQNSQPELVLGKGSHIHRMTGNHDERMDLLDSFNPSGGMDERSVGYDAGGSLSLG
eukprot:TRINITY_DN63258_c0_g1_i1.p1 TRINITY_DN63258_c0_g1~~TRINITY_DN63258_c0_g1_i1.p1  ORF type:complete len:519 (-),score=74.72 TRINITY_DN63258_c0_g1_i1:51-1607(-)